MTYILCSYIKALQGRTVSASKIIGKREFIQHTSQYLKWLDDEDGELVITHHRKPMLLLTKIKQKSFSELRGLTSINIHGDINDPILPT